MALLYVAIGVFFIPASLDANRVGSNFDAEVLQPEKEMCLSNGVSDRSGDDHRNASAFKNSKSNASMIQVDIGREHDDQDGPLQAQLTIKGESDSPIRDIFFPCCADRAMNVFVTVDLTKECLKYKNADEIFDATAEDWTEIPVTQIMSYELTGQGLEIHILSKGTFTFSGDMTKELGVNLKKLQDQVASRLPTKIPGYIMGKRKTIVDAGVNLDAKVISFFDFHALFPKEAWFEDDKSRMRMVDELIAKQPGTSVIVTHWQEEGYVQNMVKKLKTRVVLISTFTFIRGTPEDREFEPYLWHNKLNVFSLVLGAFATLGWKPDLLYSYGTSPVDMLAGQIQAARFSQIIKEWIGVKLIPGPRQEQWVWELHHLRHVPLPRQHIKFIEMTELEEEEEPDDDVNAPVAEESSSVPNVRMKVDLESESQISEGWEEDFDSIYKYLPIDVFY